MSGVNVELLKTLVAWVEAQDELPAIDRQWEQDVWRSDKESNAEGLASDYAYGVAGPFPYSASQADIKKWQVAYDAAHEVAMNQLAPRCGTSFCAAGYVAQLVDTRYVDNEYVDGVHSSDAAARALRIDTFGRYAADLPLFGANNTAEDIRQIAEELAGQPL